MRMAELIVMASTCISIASIAHADPQQAKEITHPSSPCIVQSTAGEYPMYSVSKEENQIYSPNSDGIIQAVFSPSGKFIAFVGSEIDWVDIRPGEGHSVVILDCVSERFSGYSNGFPMGDFKWITDKQFQYTDTATGTLVKGAHALD